MAQSNQVSLIRPAHLRHLLESIGADDATLKRSGSTDVEDREELLTMLDRKLGDGTGAALTAMYTSYAQSAVHLWELPSLSGLDADTALKYVNDYVYDDAEMDVTVDPGGRVKREPGAARFRRITVHESHLSANVLVAVERSAAFEDEAQPYWVTAGVEVRIEFDNEERRILEVFGTQKLARAVADYTLANLFGMQPATRKGPGRDEYLLPITFDDADVKTFAGRNHFKAVGVTGKDVRGKLGDLTLLGKQTGIEMKPLDLKDDLARNQLAGLNKERRFRFKYKHEDGFVETPVVRFFLKAHPHVSFQTRTSRPAAHWMISELIEDIR